MSLRIGVLALQGDVREHIAALVSAGAAATPVRRPEELDRVDAIVIPGGESTTIGKLLVTFGLLEPLQKRVRGGMPAYGSCAGMILLADRVLDGKPDQVGIGGIDVTVRRNAFGRQVDSFEADLDVEGVPHPVRGVFIRAPIVEEVGDGVRVLAEYEERPIVLEQGNLVVASFHPELVGETGLHGYLLGKV
jgi:pyridoxal 5'-phosphate synthase pdxT subunit